MSMNKLDKLDYIEKFIKNTMSIDKYVHTQNYQELFDIHTKEKAMLQNIILLSSKDKSDIEIINACIELYNASENILIHISKNKQTIDCEKNMLLFFYKNTCSSSKIFSKEWKKLKLLIGNKINMIHMNCESSKYEYFCDIFKVVSYPSLKYMSNNKIYDYIGNMSAEEIAKSLNL